MIELVTVIVLIGVLSAIGAARFFDGSGFESRAYSDQVKSLMRYAQKLAIAQSRPVFVRTEATRFAVCFTAGCAAANQLASAPGGSNSGSKATQANCVVNGIADTSGWLCEAPPAGMQIAGPALAAGSAFYFDSLGRPYNNGDVVGASTFATRTYTITSGGNSNTVIVEAETGYVH
jgi:MSHA pilin protein MshC